MCASWHRALAAASALALAIAAAWAVPSAMCTVSVASAAPLCLSTRVSSPIMSPRTSCMPTRLGLVLLVAMLLPRSGDILLEGACGWFMTLRVVGAPPHAHSSSVRGLITRVSSPITSCMMAMAASVLVAKR